jgi:hypothetical protein
MGLIVVCWPVTGHAEVVKLLAQSKKADFNAQNSVGETPLHKVRLSIRYALLWFLETFARIPNIREASSK